jgi:GNAT superfamily N-acetyltransferase
MPDDILNSINWRGQILILREAVREDVPRLVQLHRALVGATPSAEQFDKPEAWFKIGGPWMHEYYCERHLKAYQDLGFDVWVLTRENDELVGNIELWYDEEPEPFGRYAHMELLEALPEYLNDDLQTWILDNVEARAKSRGYQRFWCNPHGSGGSPHLQLARGYKPVWPNGQVILPNLCRFDTPSHALIPLKGDYKTEAAHLLALNHREAAGFRWRYLWRIVLNPQAADWPLNTPFWASRMNFEDGKWGICVVTVWPWLNDPPTARADLWVPVDLANDVAHIHRLLRISARQALNLGADSMVAYVPRALAGQLVDDDIEERALDANDVWYLKNMTKDEG